MLSRSKVAEQALLTPCAAPELLSGSRLRCAADLYSLGSSLIELLSGHSPVGSRDEPAPVIVSRIEHSEQRLGLKPAPAELAEL
ncbi:MAG: hypothetical protein R2716_02265 [Microthrixaceae bacterium]